MSDQFRRSYETQTICDALIALQPGALLSYAAISEKVGTDIDGQSSALHSARRIVERDHGMVFASETKIGIRRLDDQQIVQNTVAARQHIGRSAKRALRRLGSVQNFAGLSDAEQKAHQAHAVIYAAMADAASRETIKKLEIAKPTDGRLLLANILSAQVRP